MMQRVCQDNRFPVQNVELINLLSIQILESRRVWLKSIKIAGLCEQSLLLSFSVIRYVVK